jgi:hypothetical protein
LLENVALSLDYIGRNMVLLLVIICKLTKNMLHWNGYFYLLAHDCIIELIWSLACKPSWISFFLYKWVYPFFGMVLYSYKVKSFLRKRKWNNSMSMENDIENEKYSRWPKIKKRERRRGDQNNLNKRSEGEVWILFIECRFHTLQFK